LWWLLNSPIFVEQIQHQSTGSDLPHISGNDILNTPIPLAAIPEQIEITRRIETAFAWLDGITGEHANASWCFIREWGRIGRAGQVRMVPYATAGEAHKALAAQRRMKERRGYLVSRSRVKQGT
jgi:predicted DNA-binding WGR domain protein